MTSQLYQLVVRKGPRPGQIFPLELDLLTVGRDPLSDIVIEDPEVSRHHASFTQGDEGYLLQDKGSTNGSFVDGERLGGDPVALKPGQVIMFGSTVTLVYQATSESDPMATMVGPVAEVGVDEPDPPAQDEMPAAEPDLEAMQSFGLPDPVEEDPFEELDEAVPSMDEVEPVVEDLSEDLDSMPAFGLPDQVEEAPIEELDEAMPSFGLPDPVEEDPFEEIEALPELDEEVEAPEAISDDMVVEAADVVAFDVPESQPYLEEDDDAMATMVEAIPVAPAEEPAEPEPLPSFDEPEPEVAPPSFPTFDEPEPAPEVELPSEPPPLAPLPSFEAPAQEPAYEPPSLAFEPEEAAVDSGTPLPDFDAQAADSAPMEASGEIVEGKAPANRNRNIIIGVVAVLLLCCLCSIVLSALYFVVLAPA